MSADPSEFIGAWVTVEPVVGPHREGLMRRVAHWRHGFTIALMSPGQIAMVDLTNREIARIDPTPMPEPPARTVLESLDSKCVYWRSPELDEDLARWFEVGTYDPIEWPDLRLGSVDRPISVVRWGR